MNRIQPTIKIETFISPTGEQAKIVFISNRYLRIIKKKLSRGEWDFTYFSLQGVEYYNYIGRLMGLSGLIIFTLRR